MEDNALHSLIVATPTGSFRLTAEGGAITRATWVEAAAGDVDDGATEPLLAEAAAQLKAYFDGARQAFDLPLRPSGGAFQQSVWAEMRKIPYGSVRTYGDLAKAVGGEARAVGGACGSNPIPILIPCHRVVGADGTMTGFSGGRGVETKLDLLRHEGAMLI